MSTGKIERAAVTAVVDYLDKVDKFEPFISYSDKAPIIDGYFNIYYNGRQKVEDFFAQIPVQVKGTSSDKEYYYRIEREHVNAYKQLRGIVFFKVIVDQECKKILYAILSTNKINELLRQTTNIIRIDLMEVPSDLRLFENKILYFADKRNGEKVDNLSPEHAKLFKELEKLQGCLGKIDNKETRKELKSALDSIKNLMDDDTIGRRDKFILYYRKALDLATNNLKVHDFVDIKYHLGNYLREQKLYHLEVDYYSRDYMSPKRLLFPGLKPFDNDLIMVDNSLVKMHSAFTRFKKAELEHQESLAIYHDLIKNKPTAHFGEVAIKLEILERLLQKDDKLLGVVRDTMNETLGIYKNLVKANPQIITKDVKKTQRLLDEIDLPHSIPPDRGGK